MLTIQSSQMTALRRDQEARFLERTRNFIAGKLRRDVAPAEITTLYQRGKSYGLRSEQDFVRYIFISAAVSTSEGEDDPLWMRAILEVATPVNELKLQRLFDAARQCVAPGLVPLREP